MFVLTRMHQLRTPWMGWLLVLALVVAPALGRMHEVLHAPVLPSTNATPPHAHHHGVDALFGEHSALECLALDQLSHGLDGSEPPPHHWLALPRSAPIWCAAKERLPAALALFQARAPPRANS